MRTSHFIFFLSCLVLTLNGFCQKEIRNVVNTAEDYKVKAHQLLDSTHAFEGKYSLHMQGRFTYGLNTVIHNVKPNDVYVMEVWRKSDSQQPRLVCNGGKGSGVYARADRDIVIRKGWGLLQKVIHVPPNFRGTTLTFYVANPFGNEVYFDALKITQINHEVHSEYNGEHLEIQLDSSSVLALQDVRRKAFEEGYLSSEHKKWVPGKVKIEGEWRKAKIRLKGDRLFHVKGEKWSFKIKLKQPWKGMTVFSIHQPKARSFIKEWRFHELLKQNDIPTSKYGFVPVLINGRSMGVYAFQEHFRSIHQRDTNQMIIGYDDELFWKNRKEEKSLDVIHQAKFKVYGNGNLPQGFKDSLVLKEKGLYNCFDLEQLATYFALVDVADAYHGDFWINQKYSFNKKSGKLQMFGHDGYTVDHNFNWPGVAYYGLLNLDSIADNEPTKREIAKLMQNTSFAYVYQQQLMKFTKDEFLKEFQRSVQIKEQRYLELLRIEYPYFEYSPNYLLTRGRYLQGEMDRK